MSGRLNVPNDREHVGSELRAACALRATDMRFTAPAGPGARVHKGRDEGKLARPLEHRLARQNCGRSSLAAASATSGEPPSDGVQGGVGCSQGFAGRAEV